MSVDKSKQVINYLLTCPDIQDTPLYFNFINAKKDNKQFITVANDVSSQVPYLDGSVAKIYTFTIMDYRSVNYNPLVTVGDYSNENVDELQDVNALIDWITAQNKIHEFPDFGPECHIDKIEAVTNIADLSGVDTSLTPMLAKYRIVIRISYLDNTDVIYE